jgi:hypothetical protein
MDAAKSMVSEADSGFTHESGGRQVHELGEYQGYNRLTLLVVLRAFLIIFAFTDSSRPIELPTNFNNSSINQVALTRLRQTSDSPSLDEILVLKDVSPRAGIQNNESRSSHRRGGSVSLPDIAEEQHPHCGSPDATASPDSVNSTYIFSPDTVGLPNLNVANPRESKPDSI